MFGFLRARIEKRRRERLEAAQSITSYRIEGVAYPRIAFGDEDADCGAGEGPCHDCLATKGQLHDPGCDVERCPKCGGQAICCECIYDETDRPEA